MHVVVHSQNRHFNSELAACLALAELSVATPAAPSLPGEPATRRRTGRPAGKAVKFTAAGPSFSDCFGS